MPMICMVLPPDQAFALRDQITQAQKVIGKEESVTFLLYVATDPIVADGFQGQFIAITDLPIPSEVFAGDHLITCIPVAVDDVLRGFAEMAEVDDLSPPGQILH